MGGSYGGYMTMAAITEHPELWRCAVNIVGIVNFVTFLERTGAYRRALREAEYGSLERDREFLESISPIRKIDRIACPLMVIHGANDPRVPGRRGRAGRRGAAARARRLSSTCATRTRATASRACRTASTAIRAWPPSCSGHLLDGCVNLQGFRHAVRG